MANIETGIRKQEIVENKSEEGVKRLSDRIISFAILQALKGLERHREANDKYNWQNGFGLVKESKEYIPKVKNYSIKSSDNGKISEVGGKGFNLIKQIQAGLNVPNFFVSSKDAYDDLTKNLKPLLEEFFVYDNSAEYVEYDNKAENLGPIFDRIQQFIISQEFSPNVEQVLKSQYEVMGGDNVIWFCRSSALDEDGEVKEGEKGSSFAGQQLSLANVRGWENFKLAQKRVMASVYSLEAVQYRMERGIDIFNVALPVVNQISVPLTSGYAVYAFSNKENNGVSEMTYSIAQGYGAIIADGESPVHGVTKNRKTGEIIEEHYPQQLEMVVSNPESNGKTNTTLKVPSLPNKGKNSKLNKRIEETIIKIESFYGGKPQDMELPVLVYKINSKGEKIYKNDKVVNGGMVEDESFNNLPFEEDYEVLIVQSRDITTNNKEQKEFSKKMPERTETIIGKAQGVSDGVFCGRIRKINNTQEARDMKKKYSYEIVYTPFAGVDFGPAFQKSGAIITRRGDKLSHAAIVAREGEKPCIVNYNDELEEGQEVTVNGYTGEIHNGKFLELIEWQEEKELADWNLEENGKNEISFGVGINCMSSKDAAKIAAKGVKNVPLVRGEGWVGSYGVDPLEVMEREDSKIEEWTNFGVTELVAIAEYFDGEVTYRQYAPALEERNLVDSDKFFEGRDKSKFGLVQGTTYALMYPEAAKQEFEVVKRAYESLKNKGKSTKLKYMAQFTRTAGDLEKWVQMAKSSGLGKENNSAELGTMIEVAGINTEEKEFESILNSGIDFISIGSNDFYGSMLLLNRGEKGTSEMYPANLPAIIRKYKWIAETVKKFNLHNNKNIKVSVCGEVLSEFPELVEYFIEWGFTSGAIGNKNSKVKSAYYTALETEERMKKGIHKKRLKQKKLENNFIA